MSKSDEIREVLKVHPDLKDMEVVNFLSERGVHVSNSLVYQVRLNDGYRAMKNSSSIEEIFPREKPFTIKDLHVAREFANSFGSIDRAIKLLEKLQELTS